MKQVLPTIVTHSAHVPQVEHVFACAWCPPSTYRKLEKNQDYTHGMCQKHKREFIDAVKKRFKHLSLRSHQGTAFGIPVSV
jgi:hypothetical protein